MKNTTLCLTVGLALFAASHAAADDAVAKDQTSIERTDGQADRLKADYGVDDARVQGLRDRKLGYGEISHVLGIAEKMPGGITDANVKTIMDLRTGPPTMGWGKIAQRQGTSLGKLKGAGAQGKSGRPEKAAKPEKGERPDKAEKPSRPEKVARPEKVERGGKR